MRRFCLLLALIAAVLLGSRAGRAATKEVQIHLITMGPGEHVYTGGGHAALMVAELEDGAPVRNTLYNYGDTDWSDPLLVPHFLRGDLVFFLTESDDLFQTVQDYGVRQHRAVYRQRLNLSPAEVAEVARRLKEGTVVGHREYVFHHVHALCSTRIMDLLDDVLHGRIRAELAPVPGPWTAREYQEATFNGHWLASIGGDLLMGRLHDHVLDKYASTAAPEHMREYLQTILVPGPSGALVPLADPPVPLVEVAEPPATKSWFTHYLWGALIALLLGYGVSAYRRAATAPGEAAKLVLTAAIPSGLVGLVIAAFIVLSKVPELRQNELILLFWPTDLWLAWRMRALLRGKVAPDRWVQGYAHARLGVAGLVVVGHLTGVLYQRPLIVAALGCVEAIVIWALVRALRAPAKESARTAPAAPAAT